MLFRRTFDEEQDEYEDAYKVYALSPIPDADWQSGRFWQHCLSYSRGDLGNVPVKEIQFDESYRQEVDTAIVEKLLAQE